MGATVYTFSIILAVFLIGLGAGSSVGSYLARTRARPRLALAITQLLLVVGIGWTTAMIHASLPHWPIDRALASSPWFIFQLDLLRAMWAIFPTACLWGASFPLALAAAASPGEDPGRMVGSVYAANTIGAIVGALAFSILAIPTIGTFQSQRLLMALARRRRADADRARARPHRAAGAPEKPFRPRRNGWRVAAVLASSRSSGRYRARRPGCWHLAASCPNTPGARHPFVGEGINSTVAVTQYDATTRSFHITAVRRLPRARMTCAAAHDRTRVRAAAPQAAHGPDRRLRRRCHRRARSRAIPTSNAS